VVFVEEIKEIEKQYRELGRKTRNEINQLNAYIKDLNHEIGKKFKELEELKTWEKIGDDKSKEIEACNKKIQYLQNKIVEVDEQIKDKEQNTLEGLEVRMLQARTETARKLYPKARKYKNDLENQKQELSSRINKLERETDELNTDINGLNYYLDGKHELINGYMAKKGQMMDEILHKFTKFKDWKEYLEIGNLKAQIRDLETDKAMIQGLEAKTLEELKEIEDEHRIYQNKARALKKKQEELQRIQDKILKIDNKITTCRDQIRAYEEALKEAIFLKLSDEVIPGLAKKRDKKALELQKLKREFNELKETFNEVWLEIDFLKRVAGSDWIHDYHMKELAKT